MNHVFVLYDRLTDSVWYPGEDENLLAVAGPEKGGSIPFLDEPSPIFLGDWLDRHPDTTVLLPTEQDVARMRQYRERPWLGVRFRELDGKVSLEHVEPGSPAAAAGIEDGDILHKLDGRQVASRADLRELFEDLRPGDTAELVLERDGERRRVQVTFGAAPED